VAITFEQSWHAVPGGIATSTVELVRALAADHHLDAVGVAALHRRPAPETLTPPVVVHHLPLPRLALFEMWHRLRWPPVELATGPVDVVHGTIIAVPASRAPLVLTVHDLAFLTHPDHFTLRGNRFFRRALQLARHHAQLVTCPSRATLEECLAAGFEADRLRLVPWGVRVEEATAGDVERSRQRYGLARPYVFFCGTVEPRKNLPRVIDAYRLHRPEPGRYTWWDYRAGSFHKNFGMRIDHLLITKSLAARMVWAEVDREARKGKPLPSDHAPLVIDIDQPGHAFDPGWAKTPR